MEKHTGFAGLAMQRILEEDFPINYCCLAACKFSLIHLTIMMSQIMETMATLWQMTHT